MFQFIPKPFDAWDYSSNRNRISPHLWARAGSSPFWVGIYSLALVILSPHLCLYEFTSKNWTSPLVPQRPRRACWLTRLPFTQQTASMTNWDLWSAREFGEMLATTGDPEQTFTSWAHGSTPDIEPHTRKQGTVPRRGKKTQGRKPNRCWVPSWKGHFRFRPAGGGRTWLLDAHMVHTPLTTSTHQADRSLSSSHPGLHRKFQDSQGYIVRASLNNKIKISNNNYINRYK